MRLATVLLQASARAPTPALLGCGSNVVDRFFKVRALPKPGEKGYFQSPTTILEKSIVGGVTLNHLSWASLMGVPTGLLAFQGDDESGRLIRKVLKQLRVATDLIQVSPSYTTAESYVFLQPDGERSIIMASGATSMLNGKAMKKHYVDDVARTKIFSTEISQVPLSGVKELLSAARAAGVMTVLDVDVAPSVAVKEAGLGSIEELKECLKLADVVKPAKHAAVEVVALLQPEIAGKVHSMTSTDLSRRMCEALNPKLVALTDGSKGCVLTTPHKTVEVPPFLIEKVVDATGAGDAFLGGLLAGIHFGGIEQKSEEKLRELALVANAAGAACCQVLGALPDETSVSKIQGFLSSGIKHSGRQLPSLMSAVIDHISKPSANSSSAANATSSTNSNTAFRRSLQADGAALAVADKLSDKTVAKFLSILAKGNKVFVSGLGKSGHVAGRMAASLSSIGLSAQFVHAAEWVHGDLGGAHQDAVAVFLSNSGATAECVHAAKLLKERGVKVLSIVGVANSPLSKASHETLAYDRTPFQEPFGVVPTSSLVVQEALVNALLCELIEQRSFSKATFACNHPGGSIGSQLN